jgi:hypothetical protein
VQAAGVPVIVLKGAALAETVYGSLALRPMSDLDLLVHHEHVPLMAQVLEREGYALSSQLLPPAYYQHNHFHLPYRGRQGEVLVEVHWQLQETLGVQQPDLAEIWRGAVPARVAGVETLVMGCEELLLYLCLHLQKHGYYNRYLRTRPDAAAYILHGHGTNRLLWFCDVWEVVQRYQAELDWPRVVAKARRWSIEGTVYCTLDLLARLFGPSPAAPVLARLHPPRLRWYEPWLYRHLVNLESSLSEARGVRRWYGQHLLGLQAQLQLRPVRFFTLLDHFFPAREVIARRYQVAGLRVAGYYLLHILRTLARSGFAFMRLVYYAAGKRVVRWWGAARRASPVPVPKGNTQRGREEQRCDEAEPIDAHRQPHRS